MSDELSENVDRMIELLQKIALSLETIEENSITIEDKVTSIAFAIDLHLSDMATDLERIRDAVNDLRINVEPD